MSHKELLIAELEAELQLELAKVARNRSIINDRIEWFERARITEQDCPIESVTELMSPAQNINSPLEDYAEDISSAARSLRRSLASIINIREKIANHS